MRTGERIAELRSSAGLSQQQLADMLYVSRDLVSKWETGKRLPDYRYIEAIGSLFSVDPDELLARDSVCLTELAASVPDGYPEDAEKLKDDLNTFLSTISERDAGIFVRRYYFFEDAAVIGERYGIGRGYVRTVLMRTRRKLRRYLERK